ncbi:hypothetical protein IHQ68_13720 [Chelatococcus sambhunathii]|uniref:Uncharacterized protein n=1 Tax=Chelatococcus sambhunathii TaxID=363953 RepID=A0ABU1DHR2_9HYPH|nr:hypothetical protein [Chelatococcus sambhunathii]MDR4307676.1 hypothetical protein [Chelatococcus sambhunathii]
MGLRFEYDVAVAAAAAGGRDFVVAAPAVADRLWKSADPVVRAGLERIISECAAELERNAKSVGATRSEAEALSRIWRAAVDKTADAIMGRAAH